MIITADITRRVKRNLEKLRKDLAKKYSPLFFEVHCEKEEGQGALVLKGKVLTRKQKEQARRQVPQEVQLLNRIVVLSEKAPQKMVKVHRVSPVLQAPEGKLMSQVLPEEGPCGLVDFPNQRGHSLVKLPDKTMGWVDETLLEETEELPRPLWEYSTSRSLKFVNGTQKGELLETAGSYRGVPYLLGGRTKEGIDCSALIQAIYRDSLCYLLPRHSRDQLKMGVRVAMKKVKAGDLYFARQRGKAFFHVALVIGKNRLLHACRAHGEVREEAFSKFHENYRPLGARRLIENGT